MDTIFLYQLYIYIYIYIMNYVNGSRLVVKSKCDLFAIYKHWESIFWRTYYHWWIVFFLIVLIFIKIKYDLCDVWMEDNWGKKRGKERLCHNLLFLVWEFWLRSRKDWSSMTNPPKSSNCISSILRILNGFLNI